MLCGIERMRNQEREEATMTDLEFMGEALKEAYAAEARGECPIGAIIVRNGEIIARDGNRVVELKDPTAHAEILVVRRAGQLLQEWNFNDCTVYTSLEACPMCENAMLQAEVPRVVYGGAGFPIALMKRFTRSNIQRDGPIMQECRIPFVAWIKRIGRTDILEEQDI
jgi:tRNA(Arg) A34 adenosine deaminase TadA